MHFVVLATIIAVTVIESMTAREMVPAPVAFLPELLTAITSVYVVISGLRGRFRYVRASYWLVFVGILVVVIFGLIANGVGTGPIVAGMRKYLRAIPFFFLPMVLNFRDAQIRTQLRLLLAVCLVQLPLSVAQRLTLFRTGHWSGDAVTGTLLISSIMSLFLICGICILVGMVLRRQISKGTFLLLFVLMLIPTTINETKATLLLLPVGLLVAFLNGSQPSKRLRTALSVSVLVMLFGSIYVPVYDYFNTRNNPYPSTIAEFFTQERVIERYLNQNQDVGSRKEPGRVDALIAPLAHLSRDPVQLLLGVGMGNASHSALGAHFTGAYYQLLGRFMEISSASTFIVELGLMGTSLVLLLYWLIFRDACLVARSDPGIEGAIAVGVTGTTVVLAIATFYKTIHLFDSISYTFWYFSGLVAARRMELALGASRARAPAPMRVGRIEERGDRARPGRDALNSLGTRR